MLRSIHGITSLSVAIIDTQTRSETAMVTMVFAMTCDLIILPIGQGRVRMGKQDMLSNFLAYLQFKLGAAFDDAGHAISDTSWSAQLQGSERLWMLLEGTHVLTLMLFAGSILFVDLRLLGVAFRNVPVSKVTSTILPYTVAGFIVMAITGAALFFANPLEYYHNIIFRLKIIFLAVAAINIFYFHYRVQASRGAWDVLAKPPASARRAAALSLTLWIGVIIAGRFAAYDWFSCDTAQGFVAAAAQCSERAVTLAAAEAELAQ